MYIYIYIHPRQEVHVQGMPCNSLLAWVRRSRCQRSCIWGFLHQTAYHIGISYIPYELIPYELIPYELIPYELIPYELISSGLISSGLIRTVTAYHTVRTNKFRAFEVWNLMYCVFPRWKPRVGRRGWLRMSWISGQLFAQSYNILHSAKGGAVETGCSELYGVIYDFTIWYYPNPLHPPPTAPPSAEYPNIAEALFDRPDPYSQSTN